MEFLQTVNVQATNDVNIGRKVRAIKRIAAEPIEGNGQPPGGGGPADEPPADDSPADDSPPSQPTEPVPYFDIGEAAGKAGDIVDIVVEAACRRRMTGFHIGGGVGKTEQERSGYGKFRALGAKLGPYLSRYLTVQDGKSHQNPDEVGEHYFSTFRFMDWDGAGALPEEWWEFAVGLFSIEHEKKLDAVPIPAGTHLFTLQLEILPNTPAGEYELTCRDEWYYKNSRQRRRDFTWTYEPQGYTKIETFPGKITVR